MPTLRKKFFLAMYKLNVPVNFKKKGAICYTSLAQSYRTASSNNNDNENHSTKYNKSNLNIEQNLQKQTEELVCSSREYINNCHKTKPIIMKSNNVANRNEEDLNYIAHQSIEQKTECKIGNHVTHEEKVNRDDYQCTDAYDKNNIGNLVSSCANDVNVAEKLASTKVNNNVIEEESSQNMTKNVTSNIDANADLLRTVAEWSSQELIDDTHTTIDFRRIDEVETDVIEELNNVEDAIVLHNEENRWKYELMFKHKFKKTPKHLTWKELGQEIECVDCDIEPDAHRPEELFTITFYFINKQTGLRDVMWSTRNDVSYSEGLTDLLAAVGTCLGRAEVHRTIRFDDGMGVTRDISLRKASRYTSEITLAFRPAEKYDRYERKHEMDEYEASMEAAGMSIWGFHPELMNSEYNELDFNDPQGTYTITLSAHSFSFILLRAMKRLLQRPMRDFYRPSQVARTAVVTNREEIGVGYAIKGWLGLDQPMYPHLTSIEAIQDHWLGQDAPFTLCAIINKLREMTYLKRENPEFQSWLSLRYQSTCVALRNIHVKLLGVGASTLFLPTQHSSTVNRLLPRGQQRTLSASFSVNAMLGLPDETRRLAEFRKLTPHPYLDGKIDKTETEREKRTKQQEKLKTKKKEKVKSEKE